jgi:hypothetical protein
MHAGIKAVDREYLPHMAHLLCIMLCRNSQPGQEEQNQREFTSPTFCQ